MTSHAVVHGSSMEPLLREGMLLRVAKSRGRPSRGQIALFKAGGRFVAHRVVGKRGARLFCCGDAHPDRLEVVDALDLVGIVEAVYRIDGSRLRRIDTKLFYMRGHALAYLQPLRSLFWRAAPHRREPTYRLLLSAVSAIVRGDPDALIDAAERASPARFAVVAERHRVAALVCAALEPLRTGAHPEAVFERLRRNRWTSAAYMPQYRRQVLDIVRCLRTAKIDAVLLKGAARAFRREENWMLHESSDIDVLVDTHHIERARRALRDEGYEHRCTIAEQTRYRKLHHHLAPLFPHQHGVAVELHHALHYTVMNGTQLGQLRAYVTPVRDGDVEALAFNRVGTALHYTIHAVDRPALRDLFLLAKELLAMSAQERDAFERELRKRCTQRQARAALVLAAHIGRVSWKADERTRRFALWMLQREDLPRPLRAHTECADAWFAAEKSRLAAVVRACIERKTFRSAIGRLAAGAAIALYLPFMPRSNQDAGTLL